MTYLTGVLGGFCFAVGFFLCQVLVQALFHTRICG